MKNKVLFIGALDYPNIPRHGDSVKNQFLVEFLQQHRSVRYIDTWGWKKRPWVLVKMLCQVFLGNVDSVIYSVSNETAYRLTKLFTLLPTRKKIIYFMIGGYTPIKVAQGIYKAAPFKKLDKIIVEADRVCDFYAEQGIMNTLRVYNFKPYTFIPDTTVPHTGKVKFVFLSRLTELKGIFLILDAVKKLNHAGYENLFEVDYYGSIESEVKERFSQQIQDCPNAQYKGFLNLKEESNYSVLSEYDAMLFPTMHPTEGFPGVIADAAIAGVPVIASNWNYAEELVTTPNCGYVIPVGDTEALVESMKFVINNREQNELLRSKCVKRAKTYQMSNVLTPELLDKIGI